MKFRVGVYLLIAAMGSGAGPTWRRWPVADVRQGSRVERVPASGNFGSRFVIYEAAPNAGPVTLARTGA